MRPPSYYSRPFAASNSSTTSSAPGNRNPNQQLRSSIASPSSSSYVTRTHLPYVSQTMLVAHCITGSGSRNRSVYSQDSSPSYSTPSYSHSASSYSSTTYSPTAAAVRARSTKRYATPDTTSSSYLSNSGSSGTRYTASRSSYLSTRPGATSPSAYKPLRLRERPLLSQITAPSSYQQANTSSRRTGNESWLRDATRNISRNKYLIKFRELDTSKSTGPIQLTNRLATGSGARLVETTSSNAGASRYTPSKYTPEYRSPRLYRASELRSSAPTREPSQDRTDLKEAEAMPAIVTVDRLTEIVKEPVLVDLAEQAAAQVVLGERKKRVESDSDRIRFRQYELEDFNFLSVLGHGGWGFVILAELKKHDACFAVKCIKKITIVEDDDFDSIMIERKILALGNLHPFICKLFCTFQTDGYLFFVMEFCPGGDLMFHVQREGKFNEDRCRFYAAEIICAIRFLHNRHIIYRDLKLDNILLDSLGHVRLVDFGMCQCRSYREEMLPSNFCGTPEYISPEIIKGLPYNHSVDWWSFGVLLYEMAVGKMPFRGGDENELLWNVCYEQIHYPMFLSKDLNSLLQLLLEREPAKRMGMASCKAGDICDQAWFRSVDWRATEEVRLKPPFVPELNSKRDVQYFDADFTESQAELSPVDEPTLARIDQNQFQRFPYTNPDAFIFHSN